MLNGVVLDAKHPRDAIRRGVAYVPQDRQRSGILPVATVRENFTISNLMTVSSAGLLSQKREQAVAEALIARHRVVPNDSEAVIQNLSGGNQQKVVVGRWELTTNCLFVLDEPTEGVDAAARAGIYSYIRDCAAAGTAVLLLSSSLEEIAEVCDRAVLLTDGRLTDMIEGNALSVQTMEHLLVSKRDGAVPEADSHVRTDGFHK
jgi:ribose transport system ATP-binding protein